LPAGIGKLGRVVTLNEVSPEFQQIAVAGLGPKEADFNQVKWLQHYTHPLCLKIKVPNGKEISGETGVIRCGGGS
jgi:hypothetical protein